MTLISLTSEAFGGKRLKPIQSFAFLSSSACCEIVAGELANVAVNFPIYFRPNGDGYVPVALFALKDGENMFVEQNGAWTGLYLPATFRRYPFSLGSDAAQGGKPVLMIDAECGLLSDTEGELLFGDDKTEDQNTPVVRAIHFLAQMKADAEKTAAMTAALAEAGLMQPADLLPSGVGEGTLLPSLMQIDEQRLNALGDEKFLALRRSGALGLAYAHLLSRGQLGRIQARYQYRATAGSGDQGQNTRRMVFDS